MGEIERSFENQKRMQDAEEQSALHKFLIRCKYCSHYIRKKPLSGPPGVPGLPVELCVRYPEIRGTDENAFCGEWQDYRGGLRTYSERRNGDPRK